MSGEFVADKVSSGWFLFYWGLMILWVMRMGFDDTVSGMWNVSRVIPGPYRWVCETLRLIVLWLWVWHWILCVANYRFVKFVFRISWGIKFWNLVEDLDINDTSSITVRMEYLLCELCVENQWGGGRNHFVNLRSLAVLKSLVNEGWWGQAESVT